MVTHFMNRLEAAVPTADFGQLDNKPCPAKQMPL